MGFEGGNKQNTTENAIFRSSLRLFAKYGYARVSMRDIASEVGVQAASIYYHYRSKEAILQHIYKVCVDNRRASLPRLEDLMGFAETIPLGKLLPMIDYRLENEARELHDMALLIAMHDITFDESSARFVEDMLFYPIDTLLVPLLQRMWELGRIDRFDVPAFVSILKSYLFAEAMLKSTQLGFEPMVLGNGYEMISSLIPCLPAV